LIEAKHLVVAATVLALVAATWDGMARAAGAFAFGQNDKHSWSSGSAYNYKTPTEAEEAAMTRCRSRPEASAYCKIIANIHSRCFAIAVQEGGNGYGWNTAATIPEAEKLAMGRCEGYGKSCSVRSSFCDTSTGDTVSGSWPPPVAAPAPAAPAPAPKPAASPPVNTGGGSPACQKFPDLC
jgi:hypothetical protein